MDSIEALAEAVDAVVSANGERTVVFTSGPEELELVLVREADRVDIRLLSYRDRRRDSPGEERLAFVLNPQLTGKQFLAGIAPTPEQNRRHAVRAGVASSIPSTSGGPVGRAVQ